MQITYDTESKRYIAQTAYADRHAIKRAGGWQWNPTAKRWWTGFPHGVVEFIGKCDEQALIALRSDLAALTEKLRGSALSAVDFDVPAPEGCTYRPFQLAGVKYIDDTDGRTLLGDEMGLGKTIQGLGWINLRDPEHVVVVCPASIVPVWKFEARKWLVEDRKITILHGRAREAEVVQDADRRTLTIVAYDNVAAWHKAHPELFASTDLVILDECHRIKNAKAKRTAAVLDFAAKAKHVIATTGTPIVNRPIELWNIVNLIDPGKFSNFIKFAKRYANAHQKQVRQRGSRAFRTVWDFSGASNLEELQATLRSTCMIRRLKEQVLAELPAKQYTIVEIKGSAAAERIEDELLGDVDRNDREAMAAKLRAIGGNPADFDKVSKLREANGKAKIGAITEYLDTLLETEDCAIVFAHHTEVLQAIRAHCIEAGYGAAMITGETPPRMREAEVERFQKGEVRVFIGGITAAGEGITLHRASHVMLCEMDWRPGIMQQCEDRAHRIGQRDTVTCHYLVSGGIEGYMAEVVADKVEVIDAAIGGSVQDEDPAIAKFESAIATITEALAELRKPSPAKPNKAARKLPELELDVVPF